MLDGGTALSQAWAGRLGQPVALHVGIHTGPVVAGNLGGAAGAAYAVTGDTVNTTARLLAAAAPGTILVSDATHALVRHRFAFEPGRRARAPRQGRADRRPPSARRRWPSPDRPGASRHWDSRRRWSDERTSSTQLLDAFDRMQRGRAQVVQPRRRSRHRQVAAHRRVPGATRRRRPAGRDGRAPRGVLVAGRANLWRLRRALPRSLSGGCRRIRWTSPGRSSPPASRRSARGTEEASAIAPVLSYVLGLEGERPQRHRARAASAPDRAGRARADRAAPRQGAPSHRRRGPPLGGYRLGGSAAPGDRSADRPAADAAPLAPARRAATARGPGGAVDHPARSALPGRDPRAGRRPVRRRRSTSFGACKTSSPRAPEATRSSSRRSSAAWWARACSCARAIAGLHRRLRDRGRPADPSRAAALPRRSAARRLRGGCSRRRPCWGRSSTRRSCAPWRARPRPSRRRSTGSSRQISSRPSATRREGGRYRFTHALVHEVVYQNLLLSRRTEMHERVGPGARARGRPAPGAAERPGGARPPLEPQPGQATRARATWWPPATGRARSTPTTTRSATTSARSEPLPSAAAVTRQAAGRARAAGRSARAHRAAGRGSGALRGGAARRSSATGDRAAAARLQRKIGGLHWEAGDRERAERLLRGRPGAARRGRRSDRARASLPGDRAAGVSRRRQRRRDRLGRAGAGRSGARGARRAAEPERAREAAAMRAHAYNTLGVALARTGRLDRGRRADRAQHRARRGARPAAGRLPRVHEPRRALQLARPAPQHRDLPARARDREEGGRSRLPVAPLREPGGGLLRAHRSVRGRRRRGGADRHRPRPPARPARPPGGTADRPRPDPPVPRRAQPGLRHVRGGPGSGRAGRASRSSSSPATTAWRPSISTPATRPWPRPTWPRRRRSASGPASSPTR